MMSVLEGNVPQVAGANRGIVDDPIKLTIYGET